MQEKNGLFRSRSTQSQISRWKAECQFSKKLFSSVAYGHSHMDKPVCACWHLELPASAWHGSDLFAVLGQMALGLGGAFSRVLSPQLSDVWIVQVSNFMEEGSVHVPCRCRVRIERKWWDPRSLGQLWTCSSPFLLIICSPSLSTEVLSDLDFPCNRIL